MANARIEGGLKCSRTNLKPLMSWAAYGPVNLPVSIAKEWLLTLNLVRDIRCFVISSWNWCLNSLHLLSLFDAFPRIATQWSLYVSKPLLNYKHTEGLALQCCSLHHLIWDVMKLIIWSGPSYTCPTHKHSSISSLVELRTSVNRTKELKGCGYSDV